MPADQQHRVTASPKLGLLEYMLKQHHSLIIVSVDQMRQHRLHRLTPAALPLVGMWRGKYETSFCMARSEFDRILNVEYSLFANQHAILEIKRQNIMWKGRLLFNTGGFTWLDGYLHKLDKSDRYRIDEGYHTDWTYDPSSDDFYVFR